MTAARQLVRYRHYKGGLYDLIGIAAHSETGAFLVVYRSVKDGRLWVRPIEMWHETVEVGGQLVPRFAPVKEQR